MFNCNVVLFEPEIPQNTGNIVRTCAAVGARLHLIKPLGFSVKNKYLKRAGLDYWHMVEIKYYEDIYEFIVMHPGGNFVFLTKKASQTYDKADFSSDVFFIFGKETTGLPENILEEYWERCYRIPMKADARSLNISNAVAIVVYEASKQNGFIGLKVQGSNKSS